MPFFFGNISSPVMSYLPPNRVENKQALRFIETASIPELQEMLRAENQRRFLAKRGKLRSWSEGERRQIRSICFNRLDADSQGYVSLDSVLNLFLSLGLASTREDIEKFAIKARIKYSALLDYDEFLSVVSLIMEDLSPSASERLKTVITGTSDGISLPALASGERRGLMMNGLLSGDSRGIKVMKGVELQLLRGGLTREARESLTLTKLKQRVK
jgi:hypothetical protein